MILLNEGIAIINNKFKRKASMCLSFLKTSYKKKMKVADMHCDTISALYNSRKEGENNFAKHRNHVNYSTPSLRNNHLHIDLEKMKKADYLVQNFGLFVNLQGENDPLEHCLKLIDLFYIEMENNKDIISPVLNVKEIQENANKGKMSALLTIEEGGVTKGSISHLRNFYRLGVRMLTLTWNYENEIGYPSLNRSKAKRTRTNLKGLTDFGIEFIREMEKLGMIIDVSHLSDDGVRDILKYTEAPFVASHSNARSICNHPRNLPDELIKQMADRGCVIGINFYPPFLEDEESIGEVSRYKIPNVKPSEDINRGTISSIIRHIKHIINIGGADCVGLGSDFDGISGHEELKDASYLPKLVLALEESGMSQEVIEKIFYKNVMNLYEEVL